MAMRYGSGVAIPINDLMESRSDMSGAERVARCKLATLYRLVHEYGWTQIVFNHISLRLNEENDHYLVNAFGLMYEEVTAGNLLKVNTKGEVLDKGSTDLGFNAAGMTLHSAVHEVRPDLNCVIHVHTPDVVAVSSMKCGLLPISQEALTLGEVSYHPYNGILIDLEEKTQIQENLGPHNKVMILQNHGLLACGDSVEQAFLYLYTAMEACSAQVRTMTAAGGSLDGLVLLDRKELSARTEEVADADITMGADDQVTWTAGEMQFEALARQLDRRGLNTGYPYKKRNLLE